MKRLLRGYSCCALRQSSSQQFYRPLHRFSSILTLNDSALLDEYRNFCGEHVLQGGGSGGVPIVPLANYFARVFQLQPSETERFIHGTEIFLIHGGRVFLRSEYETNLKLYEPILKSISNSIPPEGISSDAIKALILREAPDFSPTAIGSFTLKEALLRYPQFFVIENVGRVGKWIARNPLSILSRTPELVLDEDATERQRVNILSQKLYDVECRLRRGAASAAKPANSSTNSSRKKSGGGGGGTEDGFVPLRDLINELSPAEKASLSLTTPQLQLATLSNNKYFDKRYKITILPKLKPRGAHVFVDGDGLSPEDAANLWASLQLLKMKSTNFVARPSESTAHSAQDFVCNHPLRSWSVIELEVFRLKSSSEVILQDVVFLCSDAHHALYTEKISRKTRFPDARVIVASPNKIKEVIH